MIKSIWKPLYKKSQVVEYQLFDTINLTGVKGTTAYKVIWTCDSEKCRTPNQLHSINAGHLIKQKMNFNIQICRPCQVSGEGNGRFGDRRKWSDFFDEDELISLKNRYSEKWRGKNNPSLRDDVKIKKNQNIIDETFLKKVVEEKNFKLIDILSLNGKKSKIKVECINNHISEKTYTNFRAKNKKFICERCYYDSIQLSMTEEELQKYRYYNKMVRAITARTYRQYTNEINPMNLKLSRGEYHLDHKFSISEGYKLNIPPQIIGSKENLEIITEKENCSKQHRCSISYDELIEKTQYLLIKKQ